MPDDVAVIGHDNWFEIVTLSRPELTSIDNLATDIGSQAANMLLDAIQGYPHHGVKSLPCKLVQRESTICLE